MSGPTPEEIQAGSDALVDANALNAHLADVQAVVDKLRSLPPILARALLNGLLMALGAIAGPGASALSRAVASGSEKLIRKGLDQVDEKLGG